MLPQSVPLCTFSTSSLSRDKQMDTKWRGQSKLLLQAVSYFCLCSLHWYPIAACVSVKPLKLAYTSHLHPTWRHHSDSALYAEARATFTLHHYGSKSDMHQNFFPSLQAVVITFPGSPALSSNTEQGPRSYVSIDISPLTQAACVKLVSLQTTVTRMKHRKQLSNDIRRSVKLHLLSVVNGNENEKFQIL